MSKIEISKNICGVQSSSFGQVHSPQVTEQMGELAHAIECLAKEVSGMFDLYRPVLRMEPTEECVDKVQESSLVPLAESIREMRCNVSRIKRSIVTLKELCEL